MKRTTGYFLERRILAGWTTPRRDVEPCEDVITALEREEEYGPRAYVELRCRRLLASPRDDVTDALGV